MAAKKKQGAPQEGKRVIVVNGRQLECSPVDMQLVQLVTEPASGQQVPVLIEPGTLLVVLADITPEPAQGEPTE